MKSIINIAFVLSILFVSCKKQLEETPYSSLPPEQVFKDEAGLKKATLGAYQSWTFTGNDMSETLQRFVLVEGSNRYAAPGMGGGTGLVAPYYRYGHIPTDAAINTVWRRLFLSVARANTVIGNANVAVKDPSIANIYIAEARFLRAYAYFNLVRLYGGVPIIDREIKSLEDEDLIYAAKATIEQTYNFIIDDLKYAESTLPDKWEGTDIGRISAGIAKAVLGKVYLTMGGEPLNKTEYFDLAAAKLQEVVGGANEAKYNFGLIDNFVDVFKLTNERNKEILLSFGFFVNSVNPNGSPYPFYLFPRGLTATAEQTSYGLAYDLFQLFDEGDTRRDVTLVERYVYTNTFQNEFDYGDSIIFDPVDKKYRNKRNGVVWGNPTAPNGISYGKLARDPRPAGGANNSYSTDMIEMRFSDVLLCLAEALIESGNSADAMQHIDRVRARAHADPYGALSEEDARAAVRKERKLELVGEFTSLYDIRRWGVLEEEMAATSVTNIVENTIAAYDPKFYLYPIPQSQIDANPALIQNDGWK
ncbi:MAG: RagB/SusD family nutrient uptake outer membrane protein [Chitinophagaceae bacterium]|nr:RagB/SusD family nutrient uptake outer membrane protein [Chitinophagaceae bacterium]